MTIHKSIKTLKHKSTAGFTLIELLVVIAIIGILSTLAVVSLGGARERARDSKRLADVRNVQTALEIYFTDNNGYPAGVASGACTTGVDTLEGCCLDSDDAGTAGGPGWLTTCDTTDRLITVPDDPRDTGDNDNYMYRRNTGASDYSVQFNLERGTSELSVGLNCARPSGLTSGACPVL